MVLRLETHPQDALITHNPHQRPDDNETSLKASGLHYYPPAVVFGSWGIDRRSAAANWLYLYKRNFFYPAGVAGILASISFQKCHVQGCAKLA